MKFNTISKKVLTIALAALPLVSCTEDIMDDINHNKNNPENVTSKYTMTDLMLGTAFGTVGGDFNVYASIYMEHEVGVENQTFNAETRKGEPSVASTYDNMWKGAYSNIRSAKDVIAKCSKGGVEEGNDITLGVAKLFYAYNAAILTDLFGDIPYSEACLFTELGTPLFMQPKVDKQEAIYKDIMKNIDEAIVLLDGKDEASSKYMGSQDLIYGQKKESEEVEKTLWKKAAYGLKARYTMRLLAKSENKRKDLQTIITCIEKSFASADEECKLNVYDGGNQNNPTYAFMASRLGFGASQSLINKLTERNDPRLNKIYATTWNKVKGIPTEQVKDAAKIKKAVNGNPVQSTMNYDCSLSSFAASAPTHLLSYHELLFLKAEAYARLNETTKAKETLKDAVVAGFKNLSVSLASAAAYLSIENSDTDLSETVAEDYFNNSVSALFDKAPLKEIMIQKYLAFYGANGESVEAYNDYRRLKALNEDFITLENPENASKFPLRFIYGASDVQANPNVKELVGDGQYVYTENVWWAGGKR